MTWLMFDCICKLICCACVCVGDPRRPYPTDLEMRSGMLGNMSNMSTNGVNGHLPGDALAAGRLPGRFYSSVQMFDSSVRVFFLF